MAFAKCWQQGRANPNCLAQADKFNKPASISAPHQACGVRTEVLTANNSFKLSRK
jgi:hypothetical protein